MVIRRLPKVKAGDTSRDGREWEMKDNMGYSQSQADKYQFVMVDNLWKKAIVTDVAIPSDSNTQKKEHEKLEKKKSQMLKQKIKKI